MKGMVVVAGGITDVVGRKNEVVPWGVNMVTWVLEFQQTWTNQRILSLQLVHFVSLYMMFCSLLFLLQIL